MIDRFAIFMMYVEDRLKEPSTWQGIGFLVTLTGSKIGLGMDWGQAAGLGGILSAALKMIIPDKKADISTLDKAVITANVTADVKADIKASQ